ncbi:6-phosphofructokinase [Candidatus Koribacter versatilis Ellin345]|uniref:ATP-dependent 6-phosphofructokinase n=1 Tax=Koribacter versatilis (strain Ellin345) TaxID=204669 RepID=Q1IJ64_KORVE|nr:ATP-dependent 6-phosphofructokinase [Candidatus Koribacter versatilis]ABF43086.1 6-phosphofructokinase [Candidatus Koribacter versatilis Ellin345]
MSDIKKIAINTGGGDAPGLNAVIHGAVYAARRLGWEVFGIRDGYDGILEPHRYPNGGLIQLNRGVVRDISHVGGTILGTTNRGNPFRRVITAADGTKHETDCSDQILNFFRDRGIDALISIGGDGSLTIANGLAKKGLRVVGVPKTIDNDLESTAMTFGFNTAVSFATECIDRLHSTALSHQRILVVEVMGRYAGWIALHCGVAGRADAILIPEIPYKIENVANALKLRHQDGKPYSIVVVAEGAKAHGKDVTIREREVGKAERLGGIGEQVTQQLQSLTGKESRTVVLGHLLRGGSPTALDRNLGVTFGAGAVEALAEGRSTVMVALHPPHLAFVPLEEAIAKLRLVPPDSDLVLTARAIGIAFGDE